jgi:uncharacterized protein (TIGR02996 family)
MLGVTSTDNERNLMTAQFGEILRYQGEEHSLFSNPLERYFERSGTRPRFSGMNTACWRGYVATWEFQDNVLFLTDINARVDEKEVTVADLFPGSDGRVRAVWVTDLFRVPQGDCVNYVHMGYGSIYERDLFLSVWEGRLVLAEVVDNGSEQGISSEATNQLDHVFEPDEATFIRAIRATPKDRTTRLVYADWLDERNDPRGKLIRLEDEREAAQVRAMPKRWVRQRKIVQKQVKHWLWMKLLDYPLPKSEWGGELLDW